MMTYHSGQLRPLGPLVTAHLDPELPPPPPPLRIGQSVYNKRA